MTQSQPRSSNRSDRLERHLTAEALLHEPRCRDMGANRSAIDVVMPGNASSGRLGNNCRPPTRARASHWESASADPTREIKTKTHLRETRGGAAVADAVDTDPVAACVREIMAERSTWTGSAADLLRAGADLGDDRVLRRGGGPRIPTRWLAGCVLLRRLCMPSESRLVLVAKAAVRALGPVEFNGRRAFLPQIVLATDDAAGEASRQLVRGGRAA
jgi:hypothetical protein